MTPANPDRTTNILLAAVEIIAIAIVIASFMTWVRFDSTETLQDGPHFTSVEVSGDDLTGATNLGDGVVTSAAGALAAVLAIAARFAAGSRSILAAGIAIAGLTACGVATYDTFKEWVSTGTGALIAVEVHVTLYAAMMITAVLGLAQGLAGLALFLMAQRSERERQLAATDDSEEEEPLA